MQITLEIYSAISDELQCKRLSRKLALLCYFLNTRLDNTDTKFAHGGVFGRSFSNGYNALKGMTNFEVVVNQKYVINNAFYLDDDKVADEDFRGFSQHFIQILSGLSQEFQNFGSYKFINCQPIIVGNYYLRESGIDGRTLGNNYNSGFQQQGHISTVHVPQTTTYNQTVQPTHNTNFNTYQNFNSQPMNLNGSQYHQSGNVSVNRQMSSTVQAPVNVSVNRGVVNNTSLSGSISGGVVNNNLSGRKTVINMPSNASFNNDSINKNNANKRMSSII